MFPTDSFQISAARALQWEISHIPWNSETVNAHNHKACIKTIPQKKRVEPKFAASLHHFAQHKQHRYASPLYRMKKQWESVPQQWALLLMAQAVQYPQVDLMCLQEQLFRQGCWWW